MRISDWSSDVCSSDLRSAYRRSVRAGWHGPTNGLLHGSVWTRNGPCCERPFGSAAGYDRRSGQSRLGFRHGERPQGWPRRRRRSPPAARTAPERSEEHTSELQSLMRISYAVFCLKKKKLTLSLFSFYFLFSFSLPI